MRGDGVRAAEHGRGGVVELDPGEFTGEVHGRLARPRDPGQVDRDEVIPSRNDEKVGERAVDHGFGATGDGAVLVPFERTMGDRGDRVARDQRSDENAPFVFPPTIL